MSKYRPMISCCNKPMGSYWKSGTRQVKGAWQFKCRQCGKELTV